MTGRPEAAQQAALEIKSIDPRLTLARFAASRPYRDPSVLKRLLDSLRGAGLPDSDDSVGADVIKLAQPQAASRRRVAPRPRH